MHVPSRSAFLNFILACAGWYKRPLPILVVLHGSGGRGYDILSAFKHLADYHG